MKANVKIALVATTVISLLIVMLPTQEVFADGFQDFPIRLKHSPTLCALEPQPDPQFPSVGKELLDKTNYAVMDWSNKLNQGNEKHPLWNFTLIEVPLSRQATFDYSQCDITINYFKKPADPQLEFVATGITIPNFEEGKTRIEIYYMGIQVLAKYTQWTVGGTTYYAYLPQPTYTGFLGGEAQLDGTIRHEIGHSLGLGHYLVTNDELQRIVHGSMDMPSIMIDTATVVGVTHFDITPLDIAEIKSIYGFNGFGSQTPLNQYNKISLIETDKTDYSQHDTVNIKVDASNFADQEYGQLLTLDPDNKLIDVFTVSKSNSTFTINNENQTGKYYVELIDPYKDLYDFTSFTVSSRQNTPSFNQPTPSSTTNTPTSMGPVQYPILNPSPQNDSPECFNAQSGLHTYSTGETNELAYNMGQLVVICGNVGLGGKTTIYTYDENSNPIESFIINLPNSKYFSITLDPTKYNHPGRYSMNIDYGGGHVDYFAGFTILQKNSTYTPSWVKSDALFWSEGVVTDDEFVKAMQYLIDKQIITIPKSTQSTGQVQSIPTWIKKNAGWWANGQISDDEFLKGIQYLVSTGIIRT